MAELAGHRGSATISGLTVGLQNWRLAYTIDTVDVTDFGDSDTRKYLATIKDWTATSEGFWDSANTITLGTGTTLRLSVNATNYYEDQCILNRIEPTTDVNDAVRISYGFQGNGVLTLA